ncbi:hypothetical protein CORC01_14383 [Colletotrichum orchidophilum]|uniref:Uncharacterized protein n=1 Tax=Colletotrichum orchidophilum TaxID=1209926 RepID=A0A1G4AMR3_9PEZI|nr:uncharacterized protein CORC01_14383 [Colletotrichum orchidophilum]OHE90322.1 hypothetical protein CORC01_14383 [Colletotrichum orchidophilum]
MGLRLERRGQNGASSDPPAISRSFSSVFSVLSSAAEASFAVDGEKQPSGLELNDASVSSSHRMVPANPRRKNHRAGDASQG